MPARQGIEGLLGQVRRQTQHDLAADEARFPGRRHTAAPPWTSRRLRSADGLIDGVAEAVGDLARQRKCVAGRAVERVGDRTGVRQRRLRQTAERDVELRPDDGIAGCVRYAVGSGHPDGVAETDTAADATNAAADATDPAERNGSAESAQLREGIGRCHGQQNERQGKPAQRHRARLWGRNRGANACHPLAGRMHRTPPRRGDLKCERDFLPGNPGH